MSFARYQYLKRRLCSMVEIPFYRQATGRGFESRPIHIFRNTCLSQNSCVSFDLHLQNAAFSLIVSLNPECGLVLAGYLKIIFPTK